MSYIYANETGRLVIKNTGNESVNLASIYVNGTLVDNIEYVYGDSSLDIQECAIVTFDVPSLMINKSDDIVVNITTISNTWYETTLSAIVDNEFYNITIDAEITRIDLSDNEVKIKIVNNGLLNLTVDSIYIN